MDFKDEYFHRILELTLTEFPSGETYRRNFMFPRS